MRRMKLNFGAVTSVICWVTPTAGHLMAPTPPPLSFAPFRAPISWLLRYAETLSAKSPEPTKPTVIEHVVKQLIHGIKWRTPFIAAKAMATATAKSTPEAATQVTENAAFVGWQVMVINRYPRATILSPAMLKLCRTSRLTLVARWLHKLFGPSPWACSKDSLDGLALHLPLWGLAACVLLYVLVGAPIRKGLLRAVGHLPFLKINYVSESQISRDSRSLNNQISDSQSSVKLQSFTFHLGIPGELK